MPAGEWGKLIKVKLVETPVPIISPALIASSMAGSICTDVLEG